MRLKLMINLIVFFLDRRKFSEIKNGTRAPCGSVVKIFYRILVGLKSRSG
jgi:hypothetical protein